MTQDSLAMFATWAFLPVSEGVKWQGKDLLPAAAITVAETIILEVSCKVNAK